MDLLYSRYSNPFEFMRLYIENEQFGEFVENIIKMDNKRKIEEIEAENERKMWELYIHSYPETSFSDWKAEILRKSSNNQQVSLSMTEDQVESEIEKSRNILKRFNLN